MKLKFIATLFITMLVATAIAGELAHWQTGVGTIYGGNVVSTNVSRDATNSFSFTNDVVSTIPLNHTFQFVYTASGTNSCNVVIQRSVDSTNFVVYTTNTLTTSTNIGVTNITETAFTGKWQAIRLITTMVNSNSTFKAEYIGQ